MLETEFRDARRTTLVAVARTTVVETERAPGTHDASEPSPTATPRTVGPLGVADFVRYAGASGDFNPLHYDEATARAAGFRSVFAQGMFSAGVLGAYVADWFGAATGAPLPGAVRRRRLAR